MKSADLIHESPLVAILFVVLAILHTFCVGPANSAAEPGNIVIVLAAEPVSLDPGDSVTGIEGQVLVKNILETLTEMNPSDSSVGPRLASSWKQIDENTWHFFLRKGVKFHDGADFNAEAIIYNVKRLYEKRIANKTRAQFFANLRMEGKILDNFTVEIKTDRFEPLLPTLMAVLAICSPNTPLDKLTRNPIGTGPYRCVTWDAGRQIMLERFDGYWGKQPQVKKATYTWRTESAVRAAMVAIGEADLAPNIAAQDAKRPDMDSSYLNAETTLLRIGGVGEAPLNDRRVRMALHYALDRDAIRGSILSKDVVPATQLIAPNIFGHNPDLKVWPYDPRKARQLLDEARKEGAPVDREILLVGRMGFVAGAEELLEAVMTMYKAVGLNVKLKMVESGVFQTYNNKPYPKNVGPYLMQKSHGNNKGDAAFTVPYNYHCNGVSSGMCDKEVDDLIGKAQVATGEERRNLWRAALKRIHEEIIPEVVLFHMVSYARIGKRIDFKPSMATNGEIALEQITFK